MNNEDDPKCLDCGVRYKHYQHRLTCKMVPPTFERLLEAYETLRRDFSKQCETHRLVITTSKKDTAFWQGKFNTLKVENNTLRRKIQKLKDSYPKDLPSMLDL